MYKRKYLVSNIINIKNSVWNINLLLLGKYLIHGSVFIFTYAVSKKERNLKHILGPVLSKKINDEDYWYFLVKLLEWGGDFLFSMHRSLAHGPMGTLLGLQIATSEFFDRG